MKPKRGDEKTRGKSVILSWVGSPATILLKGSIIFLLSRGTHYYIGLLASELGYLQGAAIGLVLATTLRLTKVISGILGIVLFFSISNQRSKHDKLGILVSLGSVAACSLVYFFLLLPNG